MNLFCAGCAGYALASGHPILFLIFVGFTFLNETLGE